MRGSWPLVASGAASVRAVAPGTWRRRPPTWSITSSPGCRCGSGCSRFRSRFACCSLHIRSCSHPSCSSSTGSLAHFVLYLIEALHPCNFGSDPTSRTPTRRSPHRRRHADPALRIGRHQIAGSRPGKRPGTLASGGLHLSHRAGAPGGPKSAELPDRPDPSAAAHATAVSTSTASVSMPRYAAPPISARSLSICAAT
jgi:hypothetical protein